jgi:hypothetical protein
MSFGTRNNNTDYDNTLNIINGNVGIGTASPDTILNVESTTPVIRINPGTNNPSAIEFGILNGGTNSYAKIDAINDVSIDTNLRFFTNTTASSTQVERMRITSAGNVGIGTVSPTALLDVNGELKSTRLLASGANGDASSVAIGNLSLANGLNTGSQNTAVGNDAIRYSSSGSFNVAVGSQALTYGGNYNTAVGSQALRLNEGDWNTAVGALAMDANTTGVNNVAVGQSALYANTVAVGNVAVGGAALFSVQGASYNTAIGDSAGADATGAGNIIIGSMTPSGVYSPIFNVTTHNNRVVMGTTSITNAHCKVAWQTTSDARDKTNINQLELGLDFVSRLKPVSYQFRKSRETDETNGGIRYGFLAQDVMEVEGSSPVVIDDEDPEHLGYKESHLIPILVNAIKELKAEIEILKAK